MERGTKNFEKRFLEIKTEFEDESERLSFSFQARICFQQTQENVHRWPPFDKRDGVFTYRAVIGVLNRGGVPYRYVMILEKRTDSDGNLSPFWVWIFQESLD